MIEGLKPYQEYKGAGLSWLATIPRHWQTVRNGNLFQQRNETGYPDLPILEVSLRTGVQIRDFGSSKRKQVMADASKYKRAIAGDITYNMMRMWQGAVGVAPVDGLVSPAYVVARPFPGTLTRYYTSLFKNGVYMGEIDAASRGIVKDRNRLYWDQFKQMRSLAPPTEEQAAIARFLDHANLKIDGFIRAKRKLIALLEEQKQAIIHRAVTRGLEPNVPVKPSGIPWIGDIPKGWEARKLKQCITRIEQGWSPQCDSQPASADEWGVLKVGCVNKDFFNGDQNKRLPANLVPDHTLEIRHDDIMMSRANTRELLGLVALAEFPRPKLILCDKLFRFRTLSNCFHPKFLVMALRSQPSRAQIESSTNGASSSMQNIGHGVVKNLWISMPPIEEQIKIVSEVLGEISPMSSTIARTEHEIALMDEYRTRLTADIVTGKLDVREAASKLPAIRDDAKVDAFSDDAEEELEPEEIA